MKKIVLFTLVAISAILLGQQQSIAQLPAGSYAKNIKMVDIIGDSINLYSQFTDIGKPVIVDVSATWCGPCWAYHTGGALDSYYASYGPSGDNSSTVLFVEGDQSSLACLEGTGTSCGNSHGTTQGNWTTGSSYPMMLTCSPNSNQVCTDYSIAYFPTIYYICPNRMVTEAGQVTAAQLHTDVLTCPAPGTNSLDAAAFSTTAPFTLCGSITPSVVLQNYGSTTLTSATVVDKIDGTTHDTYNWSGSLAKYAVATVTMPAITGIASGSHTILFDIQSPNGGTDQNTANDQISKTFTVPSVAALPITESFATAVPPTNWLLQTNATYPWMQSTACGGFGNSTECAWLPFYYISTNGTDDLIMPPVDLSNASSAQLTFSVAYAQYSTSTNDRLEVMVSSNCGTSWTTPYNKAGSTLSTAAATTSEFQPTAAQWRTETVSLNSFCGQAKVFVKFHGVSAYGNDCYVDDVNLTKVTGINEYSAYNSVNVYPNPVTNEANVEIYMSKTAPVSVGIYNLIGEKVASVTEQTYSEGTHTLKINTENINDGIYFLTTEIGGQKYTQKITVVK